MHVHQNINHYFQSNYGVRIIRGSILILVYKFADLNNMVNVLFIIVNLNEFIYFFSRTIREIGI